ncbi:MAG: hypothetical protein ACI9HK_004640 [Pirellulaceae bacterium]
MLNAEDRRVAEDRREEEEEAKGKGYCGTQLAPRFSAGSSPFLHEPHALLDEPPRHHALSPKSGRVFSVETVSRLQVLRFAIEIDDARNRHLHPIGKFVTFRTSCQFCVFRMRFRMAGVEQSQLVERRTPDNNYGGGVTALGRGHNADAMNMWFAGGGTKAGSIVGATDEIGAAAVEVAHPIRDVHVTMQHLLGLDDNKLTYFHAGRYKQLSQFGGELIPELIKG